MSDSVPLSYEVVAMWANELTMRIRCGEWDPQKWPPDMRKLHAKICAGTFLLHDLSGAGDPPKYGLTMGQAGELRRQQ